MRKNQKVDVLIAGGGLVGALLLKTLLQLGCRALLVNNQATPQYLMEDFDARTLALSPASISMLEALSIWPSLVEKATPINAIHVSESGAFGATRLERTLASPLGYVLEMHYFLQELYALLPPTAVLSEAEVFQFDPEKKIVSIQDKQKNIINIEAQLVVAADGTDSSLRRFCQVPVKVKSYQQSAIVANIGLARPHKNQAYERFTANGPMALLPMSQNRMSLIWTMPPAEAERLVAVSDSDFLKELQSVFGYRAGRFLQVGKRYTYPLRCVLSKTLVVGDSLVFAGNAAQTLHPVAGQGFNLGLRDVAALAQCIKQYGFDKKMLAAYKNSRHSDRFSMVHFTDGLINLFAQNIPGMSFARGAGLMAVDQISPLKKLLSRYASGFGGLASDLVCGIPLRDIDESI